MRALVQSFAFHLGLVALIFFLLESSVLQTPEVPIELVDLIPKVSDAEPKTRPAPRSTAKLPQRAAQAPSNPNPGLPSQNPTTATDSNAPTSNEAVSEEYEVADLPVLVQEVRVPYPPAAKAKGIQGVVVFDLVVGSSGAVTSATPLSSVAPELTAAALAAVKQFRFRPAHLNDKAVAIKIRYTYRFVLQ